MGTRSLTANTPPGDQNEVKDAIDRVVTDLGAGKLKSHVFHVPGGADPCVLDDVLATLNKLVVPTGDFGKIIPLEWLNLLPVEHLKCGPLPNLGIPTLDDVNEKALKARLSYQVSPSNFKNTAVAFVQYFVGRACQCMSTNDCDSLGENIREDLDLVQHDHLPPEGLAFEFKLFDISHHLLFVPQDRFVLWRGGATPPAGSRLLVTNESNDDCVLLQLKMSNYAVRYHRVMVMIFLYYSCVRLLQVGSVNQQNLEAMLVGFVEDGKPWWTVNFNFDEAIDEDVGKYVAHPEAWAMWMDVYDAPMSGLDWFTEEPYTEQPHTGEPYTAHGGAHAPATRGVPSRPQPPLPAQPPRAAGTQQHRPASRPQPPSPPKPRPPQVAPPQSTPRQPRLRANGCVPTGNFSTIPIATVDELSTRMQQLHMENCASETTLLWFATRNTSHAEAVRNLIEVFRKEDAIGFNHQVVLVYDMRNLNVKLETMSDRYNALVPSVGQRLSKARKSLVGRPVFREVINILPHNAQIQGLRDGIPTILGVTHPNHGKTVRGVTFNDERVVIVMKLRDELSFENVLNLKLCATGRIRQLHGTCWLNCILSILFMSPQILLNILKLQDTGFDASYRTHRQKLELAQRQCAMAHDDLPLVVDFKAAPAHDPQHWKDIRNIVLLMARQIYVDRIGLSDNNNGAEGDLSRVVAFAIKSMYSTSSINNGIGGLPDITLLIVLCALFATDAKSTWDRIAQKLTETEAATEPIAIRFNMGDDDLLVVIPPGTRRRVWLKPLRLGGWTLIAANLPYFHSVNNQTIKHVVAGLRCGINMFYEYDSNGHIYQRNWTSRWVGAIVYQRISTSRFEPIIETNIYPIRTFTAAHGEVAVEQNLCDAT